MRDKRRWGKPLAALLGAFRAQLDFKCAAIGGKDSMSGTFEHIDVPPTLVSFAVTTGHVHEVVSPEFKESGHYVVLLEPEYNENHLPDPESLKKNFMLVTDLLREGKAVAAYTPVYGGVAEGIFKMCLGNKIGFAYDGAVPLQTIFGYKYGSFILELTTKDKVGMLLGVTAKKEIISYGKEKLSLDELTDVYESRLAVLYPFT